jgi:hypothetical protein
MAGPGGRAIRGRILDGGAHATALARRLLCSRSGRLLVLRTTFSSLVVWAIGCVVPVPLTADNTAPKNVPPTITRGSPKFLDQGGVAVETQTASGGRAIAFGVGATDPDGDPLKAHLYRVVDTAMKSLPGEITLGGDQFAPDDTTAHYGEFTSDDWCGNIFMQAGNFEIRVYVSDQAFDPSGNPKPCPGDDGSCHFVFETWILNCP